MTRPLEIASLRSMVSKKSAGAAGPTYEQEVGQRLFRLRKAFGETQEEFGAALGMSRDNYKGIERGDYFPNPRAVRKLVAVYRVDWNWVWSGRGQVSPETEAKLDQYRRKQRGAKSESQRRAPRNDPADLTVSHKRYETSTR